MSVLSSGFLHRIKTLYCETFGGGVPEHRDEDDDTAHEVVLASP